MRKWICNKCRKEEWKHEKCILFTPDDVNPSKFNKCVICSDRVKAEWKKEMEADDS